MNTYNAYYKGQVVEVQALTTYMAQLRASEKMRVSPRKQHEIAVVLAAKDGEPVVHSTSEV